MSERKDPWTVGAWMTPHPASVGPDLLARDAFIKMRQEGYRHLLVVDGRELLGMVTDRDLRRPTISSEPEGWNDYYQLDAGFEVREVMSDNPVTVRSRDSLEKALKLVVEGKIGALPVLDKDEAPIGILTTHDLLRAFQLAMATAGDKLRASAID